MAEAAAPLILCVDDDPTTLYILDHFARIAGVEAVIASGGEEGLALAARRRFAAIVVDQMMPGITGCEMISMLREGAGPNNGTPVLLICNDMNEALLHEADALGIEAVQQKPLYIDPFREKLAAMTGQPI